MAHKTNLLLPFLSRITASRVYTTPTNRDQFYIREKSHGNDVTRMVHTLESYLLLNLGEAFRKYLLT